MSEASKNDAYGHGIKPGARRCGVAICSLILLGIAGLVRADSRLIGRLPDGIEDAALYPVMFVLLDGAPAPAGASQQRMKVEPGVHSIAAVPAKIPGKVRHSPDLTQAKTFVIEVQECSDVYIAARFRSEAESDWEPEIVGEAPAGKCEKKATEQEKKSLPNEGS